MGMTVGTNIMALNANNSLNKASGMLNSNMSKLASGSRINKAADDASGLSISEKMKAQIKALDTATDNCKDGANMIQTAEGYMSETHDMLNRMVEIAEKSANGVLDNTDRDALQEEMDQLCGEIDRIATTANFNGHKLLDGSIGSTGKLTLSVDAGKVKYNVPSEGIALSGGKIASSTATLTDGNSYIVQSDKTATAGNFSTATVNVRLKDAAGNATAPDIEVTIAPEKGDTVTLDASGDGTSTNGLKFDAVTEHAGASFTFDGAAWKTSDATPVTMTSIAGTMTSSSTAGETFQYNKAVVEGTASSANGIRLQIGESSTAADRLDVKINSFHTDSLFSGLNGFKNTSNDATDTNATSTVQIKNQNASSTYKNAVSVDITDKDAASAAADALRQVTNYVSDERGKLGAQQNRLEHTVNNLTTASENTTAANGRIVDTDMAKTMIQYTQKNVLSQAAQAMLAQANTQPQSVLQLLQ